MKKSYMKATSFRATMGFIVVLIVGGSIAGFYSAQDQLTRYADEVGKVIPRSDVANSQTQAISQLRSDIAKYKPTSDKADSLIASGPDQISQSLNSFATSTNLSIVNSSFRKPNDVEAAASKLIGVQSNFVTIALNSPANFTNITRFLKAIEGSVPKMQVNDLIISRVPGSSTTVMVSPITIEFYTRQ